MEIFADFGRLAKLTFAKILGLTRSNDKLMAFVNTFLERFHGNNYNRLEI